MITFMIDGAPIGTFDPSSSIMITDDPALDNLAKSNLDFETGDSGDPTGPFVTLGKKVNPQAPEFIFALVDAARDAGYDLDEESYLIMAELAGKARS